MYSNIVDSIPDRYNLNNLRFYISKDITIECVETKTELPDHVQPSSQISDDQFYNVEDDSDSYFNPLSFCAITMDKEDSDDELAEATVPLEKIDAASTHALPKPKTLAQSKENSSFLCNGTDSSKNTESTASVKPKKRYSCHLCPKTFGWSTDLKRHLLIHTGERPFKCTLCMATFTRNFLLQKHKTKMHQCLSPNEISQLNTNVAKNLMEIKQKMRELENAKNETYPEKFESN